MSNVSIGYTTLESPTGQSVVPIFEPSAVSLDFTERSALPGLQIGPELSATLLFLPAELRGHVVRVQSVVAVEIRPDLTVASPRSGVRRLYPGRAVIPSGGLPCGRCRTRVTLRGTGRAECAPTVIWLAEFHDVTKISLRYVSDHGRKDAVNLSGSVLYITVLTDYR